MVDARLTARVQIQADRGLHEGKRQIMERGILKNRCEPKAIGRTSPMKIDAGSNLGP